MSEKMLALDLSNLTARVARLEAIHKVGSPPPEELRHVPSPTEAELMRAGRHIFQSAAALIGREAREVWAGHLTAAYPWLKETGG